MSTLQELQDRRAAYLAAERRILDSQEYAVDGNGGSRKNRRAELADVQAAIKDLDVQIAALTPGRRRVVYIR